jgi:phosphoribosylformylglycinamidine synthase subunit PurS
MRRLIAGTTPIERAPNTENGETLVTAYEITVSITPREGILDPEGQAVEGALKSLGFSGVSGVRGGRRVHFRLEAASEDEARSQTEEMCRQLLANPVTEDYGIEIEQAEAAAR